MHLFRFTCILGLLTSSSIALQVTPNSPCSSFCIDSDSDDASDPKSSNTTNEDITCYDSKYLSSPAGQKFQRCISCLQDSTYSQGSESDQLWFLYNIRYTFDNCIYGFPRATGIPSTPCSTETACGALEAAFTADGLNPSRLDYSYCDIDGGVVTSPDMLKCKQCVAVSEDQGYLVNYLVALEAGCNQRPSAGELVGLNDTVFSSTMISAIDPDSEASKDKAGLPMTTIIGIAVGAVVVLLALAGFFLIRQRKRKNRRLRLEGGPEKGSSSRRGHHRASSLSFRCQTHLTPRSPTFPNHSDLTQEEEKGSFSNPPLALGSHPFTPESQTACQPEPLYSTIPSFSRPGSTPARPLRNISITTPTVPDNVHYSTSPRASRFSPLEETPISTTSTQSTSQLLPLRPYNPAEYGVSSPHLGSSSPADRSSYTSPTSGTTASPLLSRLWEQSQNNQGSMSPIWEMPQRETMATRPRALGVPSSPGRKRVSNSGSPVESTQINMSFPGPPSPGLRWGRT